MTMDQEIQFARDRARTFIVQFALGPGETVSWQVRRASRISAAGSRVWLTRTKDLWDYWLRPGDEIDLLRGERVWLTAEADASADVKLTTHVDAPRRALRDWLILLPRVR
jgi:hypothetical protein